MPKIVIAEKPSQAQDLRAALGTSFGNVLAAQGHLVRLELPHEADPNWTKWNNDLLLPPSGRYGLRADAGGGKASRLSDIKAALKTATEVILATDCDREGQLIGQEILEFFKFKGKVQRAIFTAQDPTSLKKSFANLYDNKDYQNLYDAGVARQQSDQIFNLTLTRVASNNLKKDFDSKPIGIGRVRTPTLGIVCKRQLEIDNFVPKTYYTINVTVKGAAGEATLSHAPKDDAMILDVSRAKTIADSARVYKGPIGAKTDRKSRLPQRPMDLVRLQSRMSGLYGWGASKTLETAQSLYEIHKITTYPRAESRYLPETMIPDAPRLLALLKAVPAYSSYSLSAPIIRKGKAGVWSDKALEGSSHHAIIPNINCPGSIAATVARLSADEAKLFDVIAKSFLAAISEEWIYDQTTLTINVDTTPPTPIKFSCIGNVTISPGYRAIYGKDEDDDEDGAALPKFNNGDPVVATKSELLKKQTEPPKLYTEGSLLIAMAEAYKFVDDPIERDRLKEAKGIGTAATRNTIIDGLLNQNMFVIVKKAIQPTDAGMQLYRLLMQAAPALLDPGATARMEARLDDVASGAAKADDVILEIANSAKNTIPALIKAGQTMKIANIRQAANARARPGTIAKPTFQKSTPTGNLRRPSAASRPASKNSTPAASGGARPAAAASLTLSVPGTALKVSYDNRNDAKALGARFDGSSKLWYCPPGVNIKPFQQKGWL